MQDFTKEETKPKADYYYNKTVKLPPSLTFSMPQLIGICPLPPIEGAKFILEGAKTGLEV